jgi:hypothetical protein
VVYLRKPVDDQLLLDAVTRAIDSGSKQPTPNEA